MEKYEELKALIEGIEGDFEKFYGKQNASAGTRVRQAMQQIKTLAQDIRLDISDKKKAAKA